MKKILFGLLLGGWLVAQAASPVPPASVGSATNTPAIKNASLDARLQKRLTLKLQNCPLRDALKHLHQVSDLNLVLLSGISEVTEINLDIKDMPAEQIARYLAEMAYLECVVEGATVVFRDKTDAKSGAKKAAKGPDAWLAERLKKDISMEVTDAPLPQVLDYLCKLTKVSFVLTAFDRPPTITITVNSIPLEQFVRYLAELANLDYALEGEAIVFRDKPVAPAKAGTGGNQYKMETAVESAGSPQQYLVAVKIHQSPDGKKWDLISAPKITVKAGQEGKIEIKDEKSGDGIECTALVNEIAAGTVEMSVTCKIRETGKPQWQSELKTRLKLP